MSQHVNVYRNEPIPDSDDEPTLPSIPLLEEKAPPLVAMWRSILGLLLLGGTT